MGRDNKKMREEMKKKDRIWWSSRLKSNPPTKISAWYAIMHVFMYALLYE